MVAEWDNPDALVDAGHPRVSDGVGIVVDVLGQVADRFLPVHVRVGGCAAVGRAQVSPCRGRLAAAVMGGGERGVEPVESLIAVPLLLSELTGGNGRRGGGVGLLSPNE